jgi:hypothetical protein
MLAAMETHAQLPDMIDDDEWMREFNLLEDGVGEVPLAGSQIQANYSIQPSLLASQAAATASNASPSNRESTPSDAGQQQATHARKRSASEMKTDPAQLEAQKRWRRREKMKLQVNK